MSTLAQVRASVMASCTAAIAWFAVLLQGCLSVRLSLAQGHGALAGVVHYLGFFTVLTNLLVCLTLTVPGLAPRSAAGRFLARNGVRAAIAAYIVFVGLSYYFLLRHIWNPQGWQKLADVLLHYVVPLLYFLYWLFFVHKRGLRFGLVPVWCLYPLLYLGYVLVRGAMIHTYPYYFIDAGKLGYERTLINAAAMLIAFIVLGALFVAIGRRASAQS